jgi:hypothetical protein
MINVTEYPLIKKASLAEFDKDNLDEESVEGYTDKIYVLLRSVPTFCERSLTF